MTARALITVLVAGLTAAAVQPATASALPNTCEVKGQATGEICEHVRVVAHDGIVLDGFVRRPASGGPVPVILASNPYLGTVEPAQDSAARDTLDSQAAQPPLAEWVRRGYAIAQFNVRGTGNSGGCLDFFGPDEQADQARLVEWAAGQPWSTGKVGMMGGSYPGTTALEAAVQQPAGLEAVVTVAPVPDLYTVLTTPQGAKWPLWSLQAAGVFAGLGLAPPVNDENAGTRLVDRPVEARRVCPEVVRAVAQLEDELTDDRGAAFWRARDLRPRLPRVRAAVLYTDGYYDDQYFAGDDIFDRFTGPLKYVTGPWPHQAPPGDFPAEALRWFDHWLKGIGPVPAGVGGATWQAASSPGVSPNLPPGEWHESHAWPPPEAERTRLYLRGARLAESAGKGTRSYRSLPSAEGVGFPVLGPGGWHTPKGFLCPAEAAPVRTRLIYQTAAMTQPLLVAGNPELDLRLSSDLPGGIVSAHLLDLPPGFCETDGPQGAALIARGAADLRFHDGDFAGRDFPTGRPVRLHVDLSSIAQVVQPGHRLALMLSYGSAADHIGRHLPEITIHAGGRGSASRLTLPVVVD